MNARLLNNETEFKDWYKNNIENYTLIFEFGEPDLPEEYPCIIVYEYVDPSTTNSYEEVQFDELIEQGYYSDEIEKFIYHYVYPNDFRRQP